MMGSDNLGLNPGFIASYLNNRVPQILICEVGIILTLTSEFWVRLNEVIYPNCLAQHLPCSEHPINVIILLLGLYVKKRACALFVRVEIGVEI